MTRTSEPPLLVRAPTRIVFSEIFDSGRWSAWKPRADDIVVSTSPKCGTTWTQRILMLLLSQDPAPQPMMLPWFDMRLFPFDEHHVCEMAEAVQTRRQFKAHLPFDALPVYEGVKYIHVARDGRDSAMSLHNHMMAFQPMARERYAAINRGTRHDGATAETTDDIALFFRQWLEDNGGGRGDEGAGFFHLEASFWDARHSSNVLLVHFNDMKKDLDGEMRRIARFLDVQTPESLWPALVEAATFDAMKRDAEQLMPMAAMTWEGGATRFIHKGTNGRWIDNVAPEDLARYDTEVKTRFPPALAHWLEHGRLVAGNPEASA